MAKNYQPLYFSITFLVRNLVFRPFGGIKVLHGDRVPMSGAVIIAANHTSFADPPVVACATGRRMNFMAKSELFKPPVFGPLIRKVGAFPVHRGEADTEAIRKTLSLLADGEAILVFPEGGRGDGKTLQPANKGVTLLARKSGAAVLPVGIVGAQKWLPHGAKFPKRQRITVNFGKPFTYSQASEEGDFGKVLMMRIVDLIAEAGGP
jgi:1-acyl-sn-glycerol-3-phosphate acyltransferase